MNNENHHTILKDILSVETGIICHQVNCMGKMGSGLAKSIAEKFPNVEKEYIDYVRSIQKTKPELLVFLLGQVQFVQITSSLFVANLFGQFRYGTDSQKTEYSALTRCFLKVRKKACELHLPVYIPLHIGCGLAGGDWKVVEPMIYKIFQKYPNYNICQKQ
jgi:O-acetyl-ADP-ribose deacetylase (regulator of RNase III)